MDVMLFCIPLNLRYKILEFSHSRSKHSFCSIATQRSNYDHQNSPSNDNFTFPNSFYLLISVRVIFSNFFLVHFFYHLFLQVAQIPHPFFLGLFAKLEFILTYLLITQISQIRGVHQKSKTKLVKLP